MKNILITGISGFAGSFLAQHLLSVSAEDKISGTYLSGNGLRNIENLKHKIQLEKVDLMEKDQVDRLVKNTNPSVVYHLAALASPSESFKDPSRTFHTNISGQINLLESLRKNSLKDTRVLIVSSAEVYGIVKETDLPIKEDIPLNPVSPYAVSKIAQDYLGLQYHLAYGLNIIRVRPFNHIGPRQAPNYAVSSFAKQIAEIERGEKEPVLKVGNLGTRRDLTDVRDIVRAYVEILEKGKPGDVYNIGSGKSYRIGEVLEMLLGLSDKEITVEVDKSRLSPVDIPDNLCSIDKLTKDTGWLPKIKLETSLRDVLDYWRNIE